MSKDDLNERYRQAQSWRPPDYRDGFKDGRISMRWWLLTAGGIGFLLGGLIVRLF